MTKFLDFVSRTPVLWTLFLAMLAMTAGFAGVMRAGGFQLLDSLSDPGAARDAVAAMSAAQEHLHLWTTATLDVAYPLTYGALFAGLAARFWRGARAWLILPALLVVPVDLAEGVVQVAALAGGPDGLDLKAWLTPLKMILFLLAAAIALSGLVAGLLRRFLPPRAG